MSDAPFSAETEFVRWHVARLERQGLKGKFLAARMGVSPATISQVKKKTGVGPRTIGIWAKLLKYESIDAFRRAAYTWFLQMKPNAERRLEEAGVQAAIQHFVSMGRPREQLLSILPDYSGPRFNDRDATYWISVLGDELRREDELARIARADEKRTASDERSRRKQVQGSFRSKHPSRVAENLERGKTIHGPKESAPPPASRKRREG